MVLAGRGRTRSGHLVHVDGLGAQRDPEGALEHGAAERAEGERALLVEAERLPDLGVDRLRERG